jgi:hypothetical protein
MREYRILLEGHELEGNDPNYARVTEEELFLEYMKAVDLLTINPENRLKRKVEKLEIEKSSYEDLAAEIAEIRRAITK